jgi:hypothetical protein
MNFPIETVQQIIANAQSAFEDIKRDPIGFLRNLMGAVKQGFVQFFDNIITHLFGGIRDWLFRELSAAGINPPADLTFESILGFVLDVLGLTMDNVWERLELKIGAERVAQIRGAIDTLTGIWTFIKDVWERGPIAIWEYVQDQLSNLWTMVLEQVQSWVVTQVIMQVTTRLLSMLDPTGIMAVVNSFIAFYRAIQSFIERLREMLEIVNSFVAGVANIARGNIADAANYLEVALARAVPVAIGFLANQVGLRGLGARIYEMIGGLRDRVNAAIDWLIDRAISVGGAILQAGRNAVAWLTSWGRSDATFQEENGESHRIYVDPDQTRPQLMVASNPTTILEFLTFWETRPNLSASKIRKIAEARTHYNSVILPIITSIQDSEQRDEPETAREPMLGNLLRQNSFLSLLLREIIGSRTNLADVTERYALESTVGRYSEMAGAVGDQFEADHQPQNSVLEYAAEKNSFAQVVNLRRRATNRSALAWTINVHELRHRAGRTYGRSPSSTFTGEVDRIDNSTLESTEKRRQIVEEIKAELALDATQMENVANRPVGDAVWNDLRDPNLGLDSDEQEEFRTEIKTRILAGERQIKNQPMDNLAD